MRQQGTDSIIRREAKEMALFHRKKRVPSQAILLSAERQQHREEAVLQQDAVALELYQRLRYAVPIIDAALSKIIRLTGSYTVTASDQRVQKQLDAFVQQVPCDLSGQSLQCFTDRFLDSLLTCGNALGEILLDQRCGCITGLHCARPDLVTLQPDAKGGRQFYLRTTDGTTEAQPLPHPERLLFSALHPPAGQIYGMSVLHGTPALCNILLRIYTCIGQNYDRIGNIRYAVTYHPSDDPTERAYTAERAQTIAKEWSAGMRCSADGEVRDFICAGDVDIKVIGAENPLLDTEIPVRQLLEQIVSKLSIPPFLLGLNWSSTERMSTQQADILTSELEYYRRLLTPVIRQISTAFLRTIGSTAEVTVEWENINLQDETELALARLHTAQAMEIEQRLAH
jgi:hypothetical protein